MGTNILGLVCEELNVGEGSLSSYCIRYEKLNVGGEFFWQLLDPTSVRGARKQWHARGEVLKLQAMLLYGFLALLRAGKS